MNSQHHVPIGYEGREQALIKHLLLKSYLERLLLIIGMGGRRSGRVELCYVDCFAGPWGDESDDLANTSIAISLRTMEKCRRALVGQSVNVTMRALLLSEMMKPLDAWRISWRDRVKMQCGRPACTVIS